MCGCSSLSFFHLHFSLFLKDFFYMSMQQLTTRNIVSKSLQKDCQTFFFWTRQTFFKFLEHETQMSAQPLQFSAQWLSHILHKAHTTEKSCILRLLTVRVVLLLLINILHSYLPQTLKSLCLEVTEDNDSYCLLSPNTHLTLCKYDTHPACVLQTWVHNI